MAGFSKSKCIKYMYTPWSNDESMYQAGLLKVYIKVNYFYAVHRVVIDSVK